MPPAKKKPATSGVRKPKVAAKPKTAVKPKTAATSKTAAKSKVAAKPKTVAKPQAAAKAKAVAKPQAAAKQKGPLLRGVALVDAALALRKEAKPTSAAVLAKMSLGDRPLTPSLQRWLAADSDFFTLGEPQSLAEMLASEYGDYLVEAYAPAIEILTEPVVLFEGWGSDSRRFIYLGTPDAHGELPVFTVDDDDGIFLCLNGPVDVWLAQQAGALDPESFYGKLPKAYEPARAEHARLNFGGNIVFENFEFSTQPLR